MKFNILRVDFDYLKDPKALLDYFRGTRLNIDFVDAGKYGINVSIEIINTYQQGKVINKECYEVVTETCLYKATERICILENIDTKSLETLTFEKAVAALACTNSNETVMADLAWNVFYTLFAKKPETKDAMLKYMEWKLGK